ncbi:helix-turn-helix domain-containing protein [Pseudomonas sp. MSSRFD41]|uniref:helix-turn-helix domain-containing protein n=1 Tax=unclassified Pseudomonas TaxID=196821 RepID=UPI0016396437|nr:helix-turn-helix domain-containing protein [Pseudomonas sp. MSSRFD41]MBC2658174.1 helix-turn-helix domain-containing protein [Pseudomonas sp. MSSRFD41]
MFRNSPDERTLRLLAQAIAARPHATLRELATLAGMSKASLHRFCGTRDNLVEMLLDHASKVLNHLVIGAELHASSPGSALQRLTARHLEQSEFIHFLMFQTPPDTLRESNGGERWRGYIQALDEFFLQGQQAGAFRIELSAVAMSELFMATVWAVIDAGRRGRIARAGCSHMIETFFLSGTGRQRGD